MPGGYQPINIDFTADQLGLMLFHCHSQLHMDFDFMEGGYSIKAIGDYLELRSSMICR